jgi:hypothetical protein
MKVPLCNKNVDKFDFSILRNTVQALGVGYWYSVTGGQIKIFVDASVTFLN